MMGGQTSKSKSGDPPPPPPPPPSLTINVDSEYLADLNSYASDCQNDPDLQTFDATIFNRTNRVLNSLGGNALDVGSLSFDALFEVTDCLLEMNKDAAQFILAHNENLRKDKAMYDLVEEFFKNSLKTLEFCTALENCLKRISNLQLKIKVTIKQFEDEVRNGDEGIYAKTLEELGKVKAAGDPFTAEFLTLFVSVYTEHTKLFKKLSAQKSRADKKLKDLKKWKKVSGAIFITLFASVLILSVVAAALAAPPVLTAVAAALAVPMGPIGKWCNTLWNRYLNEVRERRELISAIQGRTFVMVMDLKNIKLLVGKLENEITSMLEKADFAVAEEGHAVKLVMEEIEKRVEEFDQTIDKLHKHATTCNEHIMAARTMILRKISRQNDT